MNKTKLAKAVAMTIAGVAFATTASNASAEVMYNQNLTIDQVSDTDGWVWGGYHNPTYGIANFSGVANAGDAPFGYIGTSHLNWAAALHSVGESLTVSEADAAARGGVAEIDTGAGAWQDGGASGIVTGWRHQTDIGLIKADHNMLVTLNASVVGGTFPMVGTENFGITVFTGMDSKTGIYSHHGAWNGILLNGATTYETSNPFATQGLSYLTHDATVDSLNGLTFFAAAGQVYSIYLGGAGAGEWGVNVADYSLSITTAPVPLPGAAWLFGGALMSLIGVQRRKSTAQA